MEGIDIVDHLIEDNKEMDREDRRERIWRGVRGVLGSLILGLIQGGFNSYMDMNGYIAAYLNSFDSSISKNDTLVILPLWLILKGVSSFFGVLIAERIGYRTSNWIFLGSYIFINYTTSFLRSYWSFIVIYGIFGGVSSGLSLQTPLYFAWSYFPKNPALLAGLYTCSASSSGLILSWLSKLIVNPDNIKDYESNEDVYNKVPDLFQFYAVYFSLIAFVGCSIHTFSYREDESYRRESRITKQKQDKEAGRSTNGNYVKEYFQKIKPTKGVKSMVIGEDLTLGRVTSNKRLTEIIRDDGVMKESDDESRFRETLVVEDTHYAPKSVIEPSPKVLHTDYNPVLEAGGPELVESQEIIQKKDQRGKSLDGSSSVPDVWMAVRAVSFVTLCVMSLSGCVYSNYLAYVWKAYYTTIFAMDDHTVSSIEGIGVLSECAGAIFVGITLIKVRFVHLYIVNMSVIVASSFSIVAMVSGKTRGMVYLGVARFEAGSQAALFSVACVRVFGLGIGMRVYPFVYMCLTFTGVIGYLGMIDVVGDYRMMFNVIGGVSSAGLLIGLIVDPQSKWTHGKKGDYNPSRRVVK